MKEMMIQVKYVDVGAKSVTNATKLSQEWLLKVFKRLNLPKSADFLFFININFILTSSNTNDLKYQRGVNCVFC